MKTLHFFDRLTGAFVRTETLTDADMAAGDHGPWRMPENCLETPPPARLGAREFAAAREGVWHVCTLPESFVLPAPAPDVKPKLVRKGA